MPQRTDLFVHAPLQDWFSFILEPCNLPQHCRADWQFFILYIAVVLDSIWFVRNLVVHHNQEVALQNTIDLILRRYDEQVYAWHSHKVCSLPRWLPPAPNVVSITGDVAVYSGGLTYAVFSRDDKGTILEARCGSGAGNSPLKGKAIAIRLGVILAEEKNWEAVVFQSDARVLMDQISNMEMQPDWFIEEDIQFIRAKWSAHPCWQFIWIPREANGLAHEIAHWCRRVNVVGLLDVISCSPFYCFLGL